MAQAHSLQAGTVAVHLCRRRRVELALLLRSVAQLCEHTDDEVAALRREADDVLVHAAGHS